MTEADGKHVSGYDPAVASALLAEAADLVRNLGFASGHVVLIGGLVPGLLVPVLDTGVEPHIGTTDIDLCLSVAMVEGRTETYERMEKVLKDSGFEMADTSFRWRRKDGLPLTVEFFCPAGDDRPAGKLFRPSADENPVSKHNLGGRLSALALEAGELLAADVEEVTRVVELPRGKGRLEINLRVSGPLGFLVAKVHALLGRDKPKDAYDIVWLIESWPGGPVAAGGAIRQRPHFDEPVVTAGIEALRDLFADTGSVGARSYARFLADNIDDEARFERQAVGAVAEFLKALDAG